MVTTGLAKQALNLFVTCYTLCVEKIPFQSRKRACACVHVCVCVCVAVNF